MIRAGVSRRITSGFCVEHALFSLLRINDESRSGGYINKQGEIVAEDE